MAHTINLTDGTTTVDLYNLGAAPAMFATTWTFATPGLGKEPEPEVGESLDLLISGSNVMTLQTIVRNLEKLLWAADLRRRTQLGARVYLQVQWDGEASLWRSEVVGGKLELPNAPDQWGRLRLEATLGVTRENFWEGPRTQIPLTNSSATGNTSGLTVYNHDDSGTYHDNYCQMAAADVTGVLPTSVEVELKNTSGASVAFSNVYIANNVYADPANLVHMLEGESRDTGSGTIVANANSSNGNYNEVSFTPASPAYMHFTIAAATVAKLAGRWFRLLARFHYLAARAVVQPSVRITSAGKDLWVGPETQPVTNTEWGIADLGAVPLPPGGYSTGWGSLTLTLKFSTTLAGPLVADLDFIQFTPTDSFRILRMGYAALANNDTIVDNGMDGVAYCTLSGSQAAGVMAVGDPLLVYPGVLQRLYILADENNGYDMNIARTFAVRAWYRPRRLSL